MQSKSAKARLAARVVGGEIKLADMPLFQWERGKSANVRGSGGLARGCIVRWGVEYGGAMQSLA